MKAYDSTEPQKIPADAAAILPYGDGRFVWPEQQLARFSHARRRFITVFGNARIASIFDIERFDGTPDQAPAFVRARHILYPATLPTLYVNRSNLPDVQRACKGLDYRIWLATLDGDIPRSITGGGHLVAVQYKGGPHDDYDISEVLDEHWLRPVR
jgi:hypothetical protein